MPDRHPFLVAPPGADERECLASDHWALETLHDDALRTVTRPSSTLSLRTADVVRWGRDWGLEPRLGQAIAREAIQFFDDERRLHRTDGPAAIERDELHWYIRGARHRNDGPAIIRASGAREWFVLGARHRTDGPARIFADGGLAWYLNGALHREDGPALWAGSTATGEDIRQAWYRHGALHREDGPAVIRINGTQEWWLNGERINHYDLPHIAGAAPTGSLVDALFGA